jgi:hypothetical protein
MPAIFDGHHSDAATSAVSFSCRPRPIEITPQQEHEFLCSNRPWSRPPSFAFRSRR